MNPFNSMKWRRISNKAVLAVIIAGVMPGVYLAFAHRSPDGVRAGAGDYRAVAKTDSKLADLLHANDLAGKAWDAVSKDHLDEAANAATQCLKMDPTNAHAFYALGMCQFRREHYSEAATNFAAAVASGSDWRYRNALAATQAELHDWNDVKRTILENFCRFPNVNVLEARLCFGKDHALAATKKLAEKFPDQAVTHYMYGVTMALAQDSSDGYEELTRATELEATFAAVFVARAALDKQSGESDKAFQDLTTVIRLDPKLPGAWRGRAEIETSRGDYALAQADFLNAIKRSDEPSFRSDTLVLLAEVYLQTQDTSKAMDALTAACVEAPWKGVLSCNGQTVWGSAPENRAVLLYVQAIEIAETNAAESLRRFQQSADLAPHWALARLGIAMESTRLNDFAMAVDANAAAVGLEPKLGLGWFCKSTALIKLGKEAESLAALQKAEDMAAVWTSPCTNHADREIKHGEFAAGAKRLTQKLRNDDDAGVLWIRAICRKKLHDEDGALVDLRRSIGVVDNLEARLDRARLLMARHQKHDALLDYLTIYRANDSQGAGAIEARRIVEQMTKTCDNCGGSGSLSRRITCPDCGGSGSHAIGRAAEGSGKLGRAGLLNNCMRCNGEGWINENSPCPKCNGFGVIF